MTNRRAAAALGVAVVGLWASGCAGPAQVVAGASATPIAPVALPKVEATAQVEFDEGIRIMKMGRKHYKDARPHLQKATQIDPNLFDPLGSAGRVLNEREREILRLTALGSPIKEIADQMFLAPGTVRNLTSALIKKLSGRNRFDAVRIARERGWL